MPSSLVALKSSRSGGKNSCFSVFLFGRAYKAGLKTGTMMFDDVLA